MSEEFDRRRLPPPKPSARYRRYMIGDEVPDTIADFKRRIFASDDWAKYKIGGETPDTIADFKEQRYGA